MLSLKDKVAFISGAGSVGDDPDAKVWGNGKATAVLLARQGARIYGVDLRKEAADVTKGIIEKEGGTCVTRGVDMTKAKEVKAAVDDCVKQFGRIDILVNNVGGSAPGNAVTMSEEVWDTQINHNLKTAFLGCKYVLPVMEKQGKGAIINLASVAGLRMTHGPRPRRLLHDQARHPRVLEIDRHLVCQEGHPLQHGDPRPDAHGAGRASLGQDHRRQRPAGADRQAQCAMPDRQDGRCVGYRARGSVPRFRRGPLHHGDRDPGRRRSHRDDRSGISLVRYRFGSRSKVGRPSGI